MNINDLTIFKLEKGAHESAMRGVCAMEAVAWLEGLEHTDKPKCTCPVIATYVRSINDKMPHNERQRLIAYLPRLVGTVSKAHEQARAEYLAWQAIRVFAPIALDAVGHADDANKLRRFVGTLSGAAEGARTAALVVENAGAYAAGYAGHAATNAAVYAAYAAGYVANAAASAANAAAHAAEAGAAGWNPVLEALDGVLKIGPSGAPHDGQWAQRVEAYRELITA